VAYFEHGADVGVIGRGASVEAAFADAAHAMFALATDPRAVAARERLEIEFEEDDLELALVRWLNLLLAAASERGLAFHSFSLERAGPRWLGEAWGEPWHEGLERGTEVKGATLTMLSVKPAGGLWEARCVVDV
jgi:SHS2 domain-containing protein